MINFDELKISDSSDGDSEGGKLTREKWNGLVNRIINTELKIDPVKKDYVDPLNNIYDLKISSTKSIVLSSGNENGFPKDRITITEDGKIGLRTSKPYSSLHIKSGWTKIEGEDTNCGIQFIRDTSTGESPGQHIGLFGLFGDTFHFVTRKQIPLLIKSGDSGFYITDDGVHMYSQNGNQWLIEVDNSGKLITKLIPWNPNG